MDLQSLSGFCEVCRTKSFSEAARKTYRTQPAISLQIKSLEEELGVRLFHRLAPKRIELTDEGEALLELVAPLLEDFGALKGRFDETRNASPTSILKVATHTSVMSYLLPPIVMEFRKEFPRARLSLLARSREEIVNLVSNGEVDIGITSLVRVPDNLEYRVLRTFPRVLIAPKKHELARAKKLQVSVLAKHPLIVPPKGGTTRSVLDAVFKEAAVDYQIALEVSDRQAVKEYVRMGLGIAIINSYYLNASERKSFAVRDVSSLFGNAERALVTRKRRQPSRVATAFGEMAIRLLGDGHALNHV